MLLHGHIKCLCISAYRPVNTAKDCIVALNDVPHKNRSAQCCHTIYDHSDSNLDRNNSNIYWLLHAFNDKMEQHFMDT